MKLAFVETAAQAHGVPEGYRIVALEPHAQVALERAGRPFARPEDYVDWHTLEEVGLANFGRLDELCARIDGVIARHVPAVDEQGLRPMRWHFMTLKPLYDGLSLRALQLHKILETERPPEVAWFDREPTASLWGSVLAVLAPALDLRARLLTASEPEPSWDTPSLSQRVRFRTKQMLSRRIRRAEPEGGPLVLCLDLLYSTPSIAAQLKRLGYAVRPWPTFQPPPSALDMDPIWQDIEGDRPIRDAFVWESVDFWPAAAHRLRTLVDTGSPYVVEQHAEAVGVLAVTHPDALLAALVAQPREKAICHAARAAGIPTIVSRHGELGTRHVPMASYQDVDSVDWALCWGEWEAAWTARHAPRHVRTVLVGAPMIEEAVRRAPSRGRIRSRLHIPGDASVILYVPTGLTGEDWYASQRAPTDDAYFRQELDVVRALSGMSATRLVVKEHALGRPSPLGIWCSSLAGVDLIYEPPFSDLIHFADVVVLDAPSTTLVEALFGEAPIYIVDHPVFAWEPGVREHLTASGVAFSDVGTLASDIGAGRARGNYGPSAREPLIAGDEGTAARRAAEAILRIVSESRT